MGTAPSTVSSATPSTAPSAAPGTVSSTVPSTVPSMAPSSSPSLPLAGCVIAVSGPIQGLNQNDIAYIYVRPLGATLVKKITSKSPPTHVITNQSNYNKPTGKVKYAQEKNIPIVSLKWLQDSLQLSDRMDENGYTFDDSKPARLPVKRKATHEPPDDDDADDVAKKSKYSKTESQEQEAESPKSVDGQIARSLDLRVPLDRGAEYQKDNGYEVYIDDDGVIYDASLNQANSTNNHNKFYRLQVLRNVKNHFICWTRYGRVGVCGTKKALTLDGTLSSALREFEKKFHSKTGFWWAERAKPPKTGKYAFVERSYEANSEDEETKDSTDRAAKDEAKASKSKLSKPVQDLMQLIFNNQYFAATMSELNYDARKLPLGNLSKNTINRGFQALKDLSAFFDDPSSFSSQYKGSHESINEQLSNCYFSIIPHFFGRYERPPVIQDHDMLKKEIELLESLEGMKDASLLMNSAKEDEATNILDRQFRSLGMEHMIPLSHTSREFIQLRDYLMETRGATHVANYQVSQIFRIQRSEEMYQMTAEHPTILNRRLLWHGSRCTNFGGILSKGLCIAPREAPSSGYMFGKGIYFADMSSKSANYCVPRNSNGHALILLCEVELGNPVQGLTNALYTAAEDARAFGFSSTWGQGMTVPGGWKDAECIHPSLKGVQMPDVSVKPGLSGIYNASLLYNEYVVYDTSRVRLRYLFRVRM
ncbi:PARP-domain-containing protein [Hypoxylon sp. EC38]|nr:PARP-domain-containing protein [Hypoxylon sp. EC38]